MQCIRNVCVVSALFASSVSAQRVLFEHHGPNGLGAALRSAGDVDGDGARDFVATVRVSAGVSSVEVVSGRTGTVFRTLTGFVLQNTLFEAVGIGDANGDQRSDIAVMTSNNVQVYSGATGALLFGHVPPTGRFYQCLCELGDWNGDGRADLAVVTYDNGGNNQVLFLSGNGGVQIGSSGNLTNNNASAAIRNVGDVDGDGRADLAVGATQGIRVISTGQPASVLWTIPPLPDQQFGLILSAADLDGDGKREVLVGCPSLQATTGSQGRVLAYAGDSGIQRFDLELPFDHLGAFGVSVDVAGDLDQDGVFDLVVGSAGGLGELAAVSGATGRMLWSIAGSIALRGLGASAVDLGDLDSDGYHEVAVGGPSGPLGGGWQIVAGKVLADVRYETGACGNGPFLPQLGMTRAVLGQSTTVVLRDGAANAVGTLVFSTRPQLPTFLGAGTCTAWVDPGSLTSLFATTQPQWSLPIPVPNVPQLAGFEVALQCYYAPTGGPLGFDLSNGLTARLGY